MTANQRLEALKAIEHHLTMNRQERRQAGICTPRRIIEAARDELSGESVAKELCLRQAEYRMSTTEALPRDGQKGCKHDYTMMQGECG